MPAKKKKRGRDKLDRKIYERELERLQTEVAYLQRWIRETGARVIVIFEGRWDYTDAYADMFRWTDTAWAPWYVVEADDKRRARLNCIAQFLDLIPYEKLPREQPEPPEPIEPEEKPAEPVFRNIVPDRY